METSSSTSSRTEAASATTSRPPQLGWRVIDIVVAAVIGVACGLIFLVWNLVGGAWFGAMDALTPGFGGIAVGVWLLGGVLGGLIIRKPGAAVFVELIGASVSALLGSQWGVETLYSGLAQGLGAELVFAAFRYRKFTLPVAMLAGIGAAVGAFVLELFMSGNIAKDPTFNTIYIIALAISGAFLAGLVGWLLTRALAATGALSRFAAGRESAKV